MLTCRTRQTVRAFESMGSLNAHLPVLTRPGCSDRNAPCTLSIAECVFDLRSNFAAQLSISEVLQLNVDSHNFAILIGVELPVSGAKR